MATSEDKPICPICKSKTESEPSPLEKKPGSFDCKCTRCGQFRYDEVLFSSKKFDALRHLVSAWIRRQNKAGVDRPVVAQEACDAASADTWLDGLLNTGFPQTVTEKLDALLLAYADIANGEIGKHISHEHYPNLVSEIAARDLNEVKSLSQLLHQLSYVDASGNVTIKAGGWKRIDEIKRTTNNSDSVFIAMWFHECTKNYRKATTAAISYCGYKPLIVDETDFNGFIMDQVVALVRQARFLIADFTCLAEQDDGREVKQGVRGGVYWEAGFAYGLGKPVIHSCLDSEHCRRRLHFDVEQYRTLFWKPDELTANIRDLSKPLPDPNFAERMAQHIWATIGKGSYAE